MKTKVKFWLLLLCSFSSWQGLAQKQSERKWFIPDYASLQHAGNLGFFSVGVGYTEFDDFYQVGLSYGFVPSAIAGARIQLLNIKNSFRFLRLPSGKQNTVMAYAGVAGSVETGENSFLRNPDYFPDDYYNSNAIHFSLFGGALYKMRFDEDKRLLKGLEFFAETGTVDVYLWYALGEDGITLRDVFSLAFGVNVLFE